MTRKITVKTKKRRSRSDRALAAEMLRRLLAGEDLRQRKARRLRGAIRASRYENDLKLQIAVDRLVDEL
jgi:hypothetical protein